MGIFVGSGFMWVILTNPLLKLEIDNINPICLSFISEIQIFYFLVNKRKVRIFKILVELSDNVFGFFREINIMGVLKPLKIIFSLFFIIQILYIFKISTNF